MLFANREELGVYTTQPQNFRRLGRCLEEATESCGSSLLSGSYHSRSSEESEGLPLSSKVS